MITSLHEEVKRHANPEKAAILARFFKTGKGEYAEGDIFVGLTVPQSRKIAREYKAMSFEEVSQLLQSNIHEERLIALLILVENYAKSDDAVRKKLYAFYLSHTKYINNWDLVDLSAEKIIGEYLFERSTRADALSVLTKLTQSKNLWERRIAMLSTFAFIKHGDASLTWHITDVLLHDTHDLLQKAVGWMLREAGKRCSEKELEGYLATRYKTMPRTALRYAIERFPEEKRKKYLLGEI